MIKQNKQYDSWRVYLRLLKCASPYWLYFILGIVGTLLATITDAGLTWAIKPLLNHWSSGNQIWWFQWLPLMIIIVLALRGISYFLSSFFLTKVGRNIVRDFRQRIFEHLMFLPAGYYDKETSGKLISTLIYNTEQVASSSTDTLITLLQEGMFLIALLGVMFSLNWQLTLMFLITAPAVTHIVRYTAKRLRYLSSNVQGTMGNLTQIASEGIENYKVVRIFGGENFEIKKFFNAANDNCRREMKVVATASLGTAITQLITALPLAAVVLIATKTSLYNTITAATLSAFVFSIIRLLTPLRRLTKINSEIQKGVAGAQSIFSLLDESPENNIGTFSLQRAVGRVEYREVNFKYPTSKKMILHNINFTVEPGQVVALVGSSGGGKSTLVSLLPRFYDPCSGSILIDGLDIREYRLQDLRKQFSMVSQHLTLFNDTIANNIAYGVFNGIDEKRIIEIAEAAHIMEFIKYLPDGLNTMVGENGLLLSGGQRQRIAIARALLKDAPILILDEATSSLDSESEKHIQNALSNLMSGRTTIVIAHRLSTIEHAGKILVLDHGKIVECGTHEELLWKDGRYTKLYNMQFHGRGEA